MKAMLTGFALSLVIMVGAYVVLTQIGFSSAEQQTGSAVRLDDTE